MKIYQNFRTADISFSQPTQTIIQTADEIDALCKSYYAGLLTGNSKVLLYGIGSKGGTNWAIGTLMEIRESCYIDSMIACRYFTNIYNRQKKNQGKTTRKSSFALTRFNEVVPVMEYFGMDKILDDTCDEIMIFDKINALANEVHEADAISDYQNRTMLKTLDLKNYTDAIREVVVSKVAQEPVSQQTPNAVATLTHAFTEGLKGWSLGETDIEVLRRNESLWKQYVKVA